MSQILISFDAQHGAHRSNPRPAYIPDINIALAETAVARFGGRVVDRRRKRSDQFTPPGLAF
jgi:hypothetical protein